MRKITEDAVLAFLNGYDFHQSNTTVDAYEDGQVEMKLHGNLIAAREKGNLYISDAGWQTTTTKERLNGLLECLGDSRRVSQKNWAWYLGDELFCDLEDSKGWIKVK